MELKSNHQPKSHYEKKKKVLLVFPPMGEYIPGKTWIPTESPVPPLGILYLAGPLVKAGYDVKFIDLTVDKFEESQYFRLLRDQDFVLISCYTRCLTGVNKIVEDARNNNPNVRIICGGPYCTETGRYFPGSDLTVFGEAEQIIVQLLDMLSSYQSLGDFPGISFIKNGRVVRNQGNHMVKDLDSVDPPSFALVKDKNYGFIYGLKLSGIYSILTSRGCPYQCSFCSFRGLQYRNRSISHVLKEIKSRAEEGAEYLVFHDDNFLIDRKRVSELMDGIIDNKIKLKILLQGRAEHVDLSFYKKLKEAGVIVMVFGIESANQDVLDFYNKKITVERMSRAIGSVNDAGIITFGNFMIGAPMERRLHFENNKRFFKCVPLDFISVHILHYVHGTPLWNKIREKGIINPGEHCFPADKRVSHFTRQELLEIQHDLIKSFYFDPRRILRQTRKIIHHFGCRYNFLFFKAFLKKNLFRPPEKFFYKDWKSQV
ncbi:MAG: cobalamin-dependent protein [Candidatus Aminicenantes bacterium]|nr:cobalamin-dependent protein [Candidatus Aminicenantes bacterium]